MKTYPALVGLKWLGGNKVRLRFLTGRVGEFALPVRSAKNAKIVHGGTGIDFGNGEERSATTMYRTMMASRGDVTEAT